MKKNKFLVLAMFLSLIGISNTAQAVPVAVNDEITGQLSGFTGIVFNGFSWDVLFVDGIPSSIFNGNNFDFNLGVDAYAASQGLYDAFQNHASPLFQDNPNLSIGIESTAIGYYATLYGTSTTNMLDVEYINRSAGQLDLVTYSSLPLDYDSRSASHVVYADWTQVSAVPVPAAVWFMGSGLLGLVGYSRKRSQVAA